MARLSYTTPSMHEELFAADEYIAACTSWTSWGVTCNRAGSRDYDEHGGWNNNITHMKYDNGEGCGWSKNQVITVQENGAVSMTEVDTQGLGSLVCTLTDRNYNPTTYSADSLENGQTIYWTTSSGNRTWHHYGTIDATSQTTNHS